MSNSAILSYIKRKWPKRLLILFGSGTLIGFLPWESIFAIELRGEAVTLLTEGELAWISLFLLLLTCFVVLLNTTKGWWQGLVILLVPVALLFVGGVVMLSSIMPMPRWEDQAIYKNGRDYLIVQGILYGRDDVTMDYRIIRTASPGAMVRWLEERKDLAASDHRFDLISKCVTYESKLWTKVNDIGE